MGIVRKVLDYRLDVDAELQDWLLIFATVQVVFNFLLPCYCAGSSWTPARRCGSWLSLRLPAYYGIMIMFNGAFMYLVVTWLPDWEPADYAKAVMKFVAYALTHLLKSIDSIVIIIAAVFVVSFKDRIALILGADHHELVRFKFRDCFACCSASRNRALQLVIFKIEDLVAGDIFSANNVFVEVWMGYNERMKTRVRNNAGAACSLKETVQLNWDEDDDDEQLLLLVKNQKMVGAAELARMQLDNEQVKQAFYESSKKITAGQMPKWEEGQFIRMELKPRGQIWFRLAPVDEDVYGHADLVKDLTTC